MYFNPRRKVWRAKIGKLMFEVFLEYEDIDETLGGYILGLRDGPPILWCVLGGVVGLIVGRIIFLGFP